MTPDEIIHLMQALKAGKQIEGRRCGTDEWKSDGTIPGWDFYHYEYRVKPEPRVIYCNVFQDGSVGASPSKLEAERIAELSSRIVRVAVRFIEDTEQG